MPYLQSTIGYQTKTAAIADSAVAISAGGWAWTAGNLALAERAVVSAWTNGVSLTWDGTTPTATTGLPLAAGETVMIDGNANIQALQMIRSGASNATVSITLEK